MSVPEIKERPRARIARNLNAVSLIQIYVTPSLNPSPRGRDFVGSKALLKRCFALAKLEVQIYPKNLSKRISLSRFIESCNDYLMNLLNLRYKDCL